MKATDILVEEHTVIERVLDALEHAVQSLEEGGSVEPDFFIGVTDFVKGFADGCHHKKEEDVLFRAMAANGVPVENGPIGAMLVEHEQGRVYTRELREAAQRLQAGDEAARDDIIRNGRSYVALLRQHIAKENGVLFPMADQAIPRAEHDIVTVGFDQVEHEETGPGVHEKYLSLADELEKQVT